ncbi:GntR family transcriptional regulator [Alkalibacterium iburiense]|uniref:GntR family transcriptional regulator n=1 Tax=Alkalibacterium iburiense TaxID=290589 RepID=UPI0031D9EE48
MNVTFNKRDPIYLQVMHYFKRLIVSGELKPGEEMPSRRQLANQLKINPNTVQRAFSEMEEQQLLYTEPNKPSKITEDPNVLRQLKKEWLNQAISQFVSAIDPVDISLDDLLALIEEEISTRKKDK